MPHGVPDDLIVYGFADPDRAPVPLLDLREDRTQPLTGPAAFAPFPIGAVHIDPRLTAAIIAPPPVRDMTEAPAPVLAHFTDADHSWTVHGIVTTTRSSYAHHGAEALVRLLGSSLHRRPRDLDDLTVLRDLLIDPTRWVHTDHARPALPLTRALLTEGVQWASIARVTCEWQVRRWRRYHVTKARDLRNWRKQGHTDAKIETIAPYVPNPLAAYRFPSLPPQEMWRWYTAGALSEDAVFRAKERGWRPGHLGHLTNAMRRALKLHSGPLKDDLIDLLDTPAPFSAVHASVAFDAGLDLPSVIDLIETGRLEAEQDGLRLIAALR